MPALKIYGRRWHMASDMMPLPALAALLIHTVWIIIFGPIVQAYNVFPDRSCGRPGVQYQAVCGGFLAIYAVSWAFELALFIVGCRGKFLGKVMSGRNSVNHNMLSLRAQTLIHLRIHVLLLCRNTPGGAEKEGSGSTSVRHEFSLACTNCFCRQALTRL